MSSGNAGILRPETSRIAKGQDISNNNYTCKNILVLSESLLVYLYDNRNTLTVNNWRTSKDTITFSLPGQGGSLIVVPFLFT